VSKRLPSIPAVVLGVTALVVAYFVVGGAFNAIRSHQLRQQEAQLRTEISDLNDRYEELSALRDYLDSDEYVEAVAREQLGLVRRGEIGIVAIASQPSPTPHPDATESELWWDILIGH
jgi:cell division protein DivIC